MGWLSSLYLARSVDSSLARHTSPPRGPYTTDEVALIAGCVAGVLFLVGCSFLLDLFGVGGSLIVVFAVVVASMLVAGLVVGFLTDAVNRTFDEDAE